MNFGVIPSLNKNWTYVSFYNIGKANIKSKYFCFAVFATDTTLFPWNNSRLGGL